MTIKRWLLFSILFLMAAILLAAALTPSLRAQIQSHFASGRKVLASVEGNLLNDGSRVKVIKYKTDEGVFVEIIKLLNNGETTPVDRILLPDKHDGLFNFQGYVTRLAIGDIDQDGQLELLAPTFDDQLVPHLNVFRYNSGIGRFEPYRPASP